MSIHLSAKKGDIADTVLLPGDPCRAQFIADNFLENAVCYNQVRGELGFTGHYQGKRISIQSTGMGMPSASIYINELIQDYGVNTMIRIGTTGSVQNYVKVRDIILAQAASTDSNMNRIIFNGLSFAPIADFDLLCIANEKAKQHKITTHVGNVLTSDTFYAWREDVREQFLKHGVLAIEMEIAALYTLAARYGKKALAILTVSNHLLTGEETSAKEREKTFNEMVKVALETAVESN
jgi:purine-nucleoside phosphorylase